MLEVRDLSKRFGGIKAVDGASLDVAQGEIVALIGPNGAGKTTLFAAITGFVPPDAGHVRFCGEDHHRTAAARDLRARHGADLPDRAAIRCADSAREYRGRRASASAAAAARRWRRPKQVAAQVGLGRRLDQPAATLTVAGSKRLELARALATDPKLLLLDEVMAGLNPTEISEIVPVVRAIRDSGVTVLLIEHVMQAVVSLSDRAYVLNNGRIIASGSTAQVASDPQVIEAYLGHGAAERVKTQLQAAHAS